MSPPLCWRPILVPIGALVNAIVGQVAAHDAVRPAGSGTEWDALQVEVAHDGVVRGLGIDEDVDVLVHGKRLRPPVVIDTGPRRDRSAAERISELEPGTVPDHVAARNARAH